MKESLPTSREINPFDDLDGREAEQHFLGKTLDEAEALFRENSLYYQEDLIWMGPVAFSFYLRAALSYLKSASAQGDSDIVSCLCAVLEFHLQHDAEAVCKASDTMAELCRYVLVAYNRFDVDETIYGDLRVKYQKILKQIGAEPTLATDPAKPAG